MRKSERVHPLCPMENTARRGRFQKFFRGTDGYKFLSSIFDEEGMFGPKFFGIILFS